MALTKVTHNVLEARYTSVGTITNQSGATSVDWAAATVYKMNSSLNGAIEFDFTNQKRYGSIVTSISQEKLFKQNSNPF